MLDVVHEVLHHQRRLESIWQHRKVRLHQRLQLCVFQQDVQQVTGSVPHDPSPISGCWRVVTRLEEVCIEKGNTAAQASAVFAHTAGEGNKIKTHWLCQ